MQETTLKINAEME